MKKAFKITGKVLLWILGIIVGLVIISAVMHNILKSIEKTNIKLVKR